MLVCSLFLAFGACSAPRSGEAYIEKFERFVNRVEKNHKHYNIHDWEYADKQFEKYNHEWYLKFSNEFTLSDQVRIKSCIIRYHSFKSKDNLSEVLKQLFKEDMNEARQIIKSYIEKDLDEDVDKLIKSATAIGDSAVKVLEDVIRELEDSF